MYGLIGKKLAHSFSAKYFDEKFKKENINADYRLFEIEDINRLPELLQKHSTLKGLNVTIPYKEKVIPLLDEVQKDAQEINAVNCIKIENGKLIGYNTDYIGFIESIKLFPAIKDYKALILGTGGAAKAIVYALEILGIEWSLVSSSQKTNSYQYEELNKQIIDTHCLIVNTTPLGMFPNLEEYPKIPYQYLSKNHILYDLIYNPEITRFMQFGKENNATVINGYAMLVAQAEESWKIWNY